MRKLVLAGLVTVAALVPAASAGAAAQPDTVKCILLYDGDPIGLVGCVT